MEDPVMSAPKKTETVLVRVEKDIDEWLKAYAQHKRYPKAQGIRDAIYDFIKAHPEVKFPVKEE